MKKYRKSVTRSLVSILVMCLISLAFAVNYQQNANTIIASYFGIWTENGQQWAQKFNQTTPFDHINRLYIAFADPNLKKDGHYNLVWYLPKNGKDSQEQQTEVADERVKELISAMLTTDIKVSRTSDIFVVIGGGTTGNVGSLKDAATDPEFPQAVVAFLQKYHLNGVDIDWEDGITEETLTNMVKNLYHALHPLGYKLTLDVMPNIESFYSSDLPLYLNQINLMSYGTGLSVSKIAPIYENFGFSRAQIIGGIETETQYNDWGGTVDTLGSSGTIQTKANYAITNQLAGMMSWRLGNDYAPTNNLNTPTYKGALCLYQVMVSGMCNE